MMVIIPPEKLEKLRNLLQPLMQWKKVTLKELESAVGLISFRELLVQYMHAQKYASITLKHLNSSYP
jgi:hypothetical protein